MTDRLAVVEVSRRGDGFVLQPGPGATLRMLERALPRACNVQRGPDALYVHADLGDTAIGALRGWELHLQPDAAEQLQSLRDRMERHGRAREAVKLLQRSGIARSTLCDFEGLSQLDEHQVVAVAAATHDDVYGFCLFDEQGLGKTVTTLFAFERLRAVSTCTKALVLCPKNMVLEWVQDAAKFLPHLIVTPVVGTKAEKRRALAVPSDIYATNFETPAGLHWRLQQLLEAEDGRVLLVVDESFFVKNRDAKRSRAVKSLRNHVDRCIVLCGTPAPNSPHDIVEQFNIADRGVAFRGVDLPDDHGEARGIVQRVLNDRGVYLRRLKQDALPDLPRKTLHRVLVPMEPVQSRAYVAALRDLILDLRKEDDVGFKRRLTSYFARRSALLQICSNPASVVEGYLETPGKLVALDSILDELVGHRGEKVVVWSFYTASLESIFKRYGHYYPARVDGTVSSAHARREAVRRFQTDDRTMLFVGNPAAAGAGLTLHRARYAIYESMSNQGAHYLQSLDRIHRRGQTRPCEYLVLLCDRTIEASEYDRLCRKESAAHALLGDRAAPPSTRLALLTEAEEAAKLLPAPEMDELV